MKSCKPKCHHWAPSKSVTSKLANNLSTNWWSIFPRERRVPLWQPHDTVWGGVFASSLGEVGRMHRLYLGINEEEAEQKVMSIRCDASLIGTSSVRHRGKTRHDKNLGGPSKSLNCSNYVGVALLVAKVATSRGPRKSSPTRLHQPAAGHAFHAVRPSYYQLWAL